MATLVLVPGGWCWRRVAPVLRAAGHAVYTPTTDQAPAVWRDNAQRVLSLDQPGGSSNDAFVDCAR